VKILGKLSRDNDGLKWEKGEREMNIEHEGQTYEVLTLDRISEITHAKLAGGKVVSAVFISDGYLRIESPSELVLASHEYYYAEIHGWGIQPLRLVPREPVSFEANFALSGSDWYPLHHLSDGLAHQNSTTKRFRCVEIVEEESHAILKAKGVV